MRFLLKFNLRAIYRVLMILFFLFFAGSFIVDAATQKSDFNYDPIPFTLSNIKEHIIPIDMDGDGLKDLLCSKDSVISIYFQQKEGDNPGAFNFSKPDISMELPGDAVGWDVDYAPAEPTENTHGSKRLIAIVEGTSAMAWSVQDRTLSPPVMLLEDLPGYLPKGAYPLNFIRDVNEDGLTDIILPGNGKLHIYLQDDCGTYKSNIFINTYMGLASALKASSNITGEVGQSIFIPAMTIRDVNNDGHNDVISKVDNITEVFLCQTDGRFPDEPSYRIDLDSMTSPQKEFDLDNLDLSNILNSVSSGPQQTLLDLDGDKIEDLLLLDNGKITVYAGTADGMDLTKPRQILKSSGNVIAAFPAVIPDTDEKKSTREAITTFINENHDETKLKDLVLIRLPDISVGDIFTWLVFSKNLDIDFFIYKNRGEIFEKRPGRKITLTLKLPSVLKLFKFANDEQNSEQNPASIMVVHAALNETRHKKDRLVLRDNTIQGFQAQDDTQDDEIDEDVFNEIMDLLDRLGFSLNEDHYILDIDKMMENLPELGNFELLALIDEQPDFSIDITPYLNNTVKEKAALEQSISAVEMNGDSRDDIFLFTNRDDNGVSGTLFLSR